MTPDIRVNVYGRTTWSFVFFCVVDVMFVEIKMFSTQPHKLLKYIYYAICKGEKGEKGEKS